MTVHSDAVSRETQMDAALAEAAQNMAPSLQERLTKHFAAGEQIAKYFQYAHLPERLQLVSCRFAQAACGILEDLPRCAERTVALRKLLESKDAAVRAALP